MNGERRQIKAFDEDLELLRSIDERGDVLDHVIWEVADVVPVLRP
jgi:hypothetical protein